MLEMDNQRRNEKSMGAVPGINKLLLTTRQKGRGRTKALSFGALAMVFIALASVLTFYGCKKENTSQNTLQNTSTSLAERKEKTWKITKLCKGSYKWDVWCDGEWVEGSIESSRRWAKKGVNGVVCGLPPGKGNIYVSIMSQSPDNLNGSFNALISDDCIVYLEEVNPWTNRFQRFTQREMSKNVLAWLSDICDYDESLSPVHELVIAQLKVWDVYLGGNTQDEILTLHNLTAEQFHAIATKSWEVITIAKTDGDDGLIHLDWNFEDTEEDTEEFEQTAMAIQVNPRIVRDHLTVQFSIPINADINIKIVNAKDEIHLDLDMHVSGSILPIDVSFLPSGNYNVVCRNNDNMVRAPFIKQ